jgi:hypothetical protein
VLALVPTAQAPLAQQPPEHGWLTEHRLVHWWTLVSHAVPLGQSIVLMQPQAPCKQSAPRPLDAQLVHNPPADPQACGLVPPTQLMPSQQPPLHAWPL